MKNVYIAVAILSFLFFADSCAVNHQGRSPAPPQNTQSEQTSNPGKAANREVGETEYTLGLKYYDGEGVSKDHTEAAKWYSKAAKQGHAGAQAYLGMMYCTGDGVQQDYAKAAEWLQKAAMQEEVIAQCGLGDIYRFGLGVTMDHKKAVEWYKKAAAQDHAIAQYSLGKMYNDGEGVPQSYDEAFKWYLKAAEQGNIWAQSSLGEMYLNGRGVPKNDTEAAAWFYKAASGGDKKSQRVLGFMYHFGDGVTKNYRTAIGWYHKAAAQGDDKAQNLLNVLLEEMYPGWKFLDISGHDFVFINKDKIRRKNNLVWYWMMFVSFSESYTGKAAMKKIYWVADCDSGMAGLVSYIEYDSEGHTISSDTYKESEVDMSPVIPASIGESMLEYACSHAKAASNEKDDAANKGACSGTGWPVASGFIVTNSHVVDGRNNIMLVRQDGVRIPATIAAYDSMNDLALLKVKDTKLLPPALPLSTKPAVLGERIITVGYPHPDLLGVKPKFAEGVVNSTSGLGDDPRALQISVPIQAGNSGGPLVNMDGKVVGVVTSKINAVKMFKWTGDLPQNINYGIKISYLNGLLSSVSSQGNIDRIRSTGNASVEELADKIKNSVLIIIAK